jgi:hypothetical protein
LGEIVRGTQICNLFGKIRPPTATEIKKNRAVVRGKNPEKLQILKLQYLDFPDSVSDDFFFFNLGVFLRGTQIYNLFLQIFHKIYQKFLECRGPLFSSPKKKICKNKKYLPTMSAKESALIPLVKNQIDLKYNQKYHNRYTKQYRKTTLYYIKPLR